MREIRMGIVGTSWWADAMHVPAIESHPQAKLVACCGRSAERTREFAGRHGVAAWFTDHREMIAEARLDAIVIAAPENAHHDICLAAAEAGLHVVCEKPLAMTANEAEEMVSAVERAGVKHMTYFTWRWVPWLRYARQLVDTGYLGRIFESRFSFIAGFGRSAEQHWAWDRRHGLGALGGLGSHVIDLAHWLVGPICDVDGSVMNFVERVDPEGGPSMPSNDSALLSVHFQDGSHGLLEASAVTHLGERRLAWEVFLRGERGTTQVTSDFANGWRIWGVQDDEQGGPLVIPEDLLEGVDDDAGVWDQVVQIFAKHPVGIRLFVDSIIEDRVVEPSLVDGYRVQRVLETALVSSRERRRMSVVDVCGPA